MANECAAIRLGLQTIAKALKKEISGKSPKKMKHFLKELKDHIELVNKELSAENVRGATDVYLKNIADNSSKRLLHVINSQRAFLSGIEQVDGMLKGVDTRDGIHLVITNFFENVSSKVRSNLLLINKAWEDLVDHAHLRGFDAEDVAVTKRLYQNHLMGGDQLINALANADDLPIQGAQVQLAMLETMLLGFYKRGGKTNRILNILGSTYKKWDEAMNRILDKDGTPFKSKKNYGVPAIEDPDIVRRLDYEVYREHILDNFAFDQMFSAEMRTLTAKKFNKYVDEWIEERFEATKERGLGGKNMKNRTIRLDVGRQVIFKSMEAEATHFMNFRQKGSDMFREAHGHKLRMVRKSALYSMLGSDPEQTIRKISNHVKDNEVVRKMFGIDIKQIDTKFDTVGKGIGAIDTGFRQHDDTVTALVDATSRFLSSGLVWASPLRDIVYDRTAHSAAMRAPFTGESPLMGWFKSIHQVLKGLKDTPDSRKKERMFNDLGISTRFAMAAMIRGEEAMVNAATDYTRHGMVRKMDALANTMSILSGADAISKSSRIFESSNTGQITMRMFAQSWESLGRTERHVMKRVGIDKADFEVIKKAEKLKLDDDDIMIDIDSINPGKKGKGIETADEYKKTLQRKYLLLFDSLVNDFSTIVTVTGAPPMVYGTPAPIAKLITKFYGMPLSQYRALLNGTRVAAGLNPVAGFAGDARGLYGLTKSKEGLALLGSRIITGATAGLMIGWMKDLANFREPEDISFGSMVKAFADTGLGGLPAIVLSDAFYSDDIVGTPVQAYFSALKRIALSPTREDPGGAFGRGVHDLAGKFPGSNLWYARGFVNYLFDAALDLGSEREINASNERGNAYPWRKND